MGLDIRRARRILFRENKNIKTAEEVKIPLFILYYTIWRYINMLSSKIYDVLKWIGRICLPTAAMFIASIGEIWHLEYYAEISATIMAIDVMLNGFLGISSQAYYKEGLENNEVH